MNNLFTAADAARVLRLPGESDDKYSRGVVGMRTGSPTYPGAAVLSVEGAWRSGAGLVRWVGDVSVGMLVLQRRPETVLRDGRVGCWVVGSGTDAALRTPEETAAISALPREEVPVVVDAGALDLADGHTAPVVLTPHASEFAALARRAGLSLTGDRATDAALVARALDAVVLLKGATTLVADPAGGLLSVSAGTPWLATAGTGDVLAGVLGTVIAQAPSSALAEAAATAAWLHGRAARIAAGVDARDEGSSTGGHPITALDVAEALPLAVRDVLTMGN